MGGLKKGSPIFGKIFSRDKNFKELTFRRKMKKMMKARYEKEALESCMNSLQSINLGQSNGQKVDEAIKKMGKLSLKKVEKPKATKLQKSVVSKFRKTMASAKEWDNSELFYVRKLGGKAADSKFKVLRTSTPSVEVPKAKKDQPRMIKTTYKQTSLVKKFEVLMM